MSVTKTVERLSKMYGFDVEEAMMRLSGKRAEKASTLVPFVKRIEGWCNGLKQNKNLFTQCPNKPMKDGELCRNCQKTVDDTGKPKCGLASDRETEGTMWRDPKGREPIHFGNVFNKGNYNKEEVISEMKRLYQIEEVDDDLFEKQTKRGRPKKANPIVENSHEEKQKKTRGRPKKSGKVVDAECNDLIDALMAEAKEEVTEPVEPVEEVTEPVEPVEEEEAKPKLHAPRKALEKKPRKAKLTDEEKEAAKQAKLAEKEAAKAAKLAEKEAAKQAKQAKKEAAKQAKKEAVEEPVEKVTEIYDEEEIQVIEFTYEDDKKYLRDNENQVYDYHTHEVIGIWNEETMKIEEFK
jgi:chemotaxis protein histidine kinase CheA